jgi:hypothetical protein
VAGGLEITTKQTEKLFWMCQSFQSLQGRARRLLTAAPPPPLCSRLELESSNEIKLKPANAFFTSKMPKLVTKAGRHHIRLREGAYSTSTRLKSEPIPNRSSAPSPPNPPPPPHVSRFVTEGAFVITRAAAAAATQCHPSECCGVWQLLALSWHYAPFHALCLECIDD